MIASTLRYFVYAYLLAIALLVFIDKALSKEYHPRNMCDFYVNGVVITYPRMSMNFRNCKAWVMEGVFHNIGKPLEEQDFYQCKCLEGSAQS